MMDFMSEYMKRLLQLVKLAVWDNEGHMYAPVWGYGDEIMFYAPYREAVDLFNIWVKENRHEYED